jgi:hypothetical protein
MTQTSTDTRTDSTVARDFTARGFTVLDSETFGSGGFWVEFATRAEVFAAGRTVLNAFEADDDAGFPSVVFTEDNRLTVTFRRP